jgi:hypothetical protein
MYQISNPKLYTCFSCLTQFTCAHLSLSALGKESHGMTDNQQPNLETLGQCSTSLALYASKASRIGRLHPTIKSLIDSLNPYGGVSTRIMEWGGGCAIPMLM